MLKIDEGSKLFMKKINAISKSSQEVFFQIILHLLVFSFYSFDKNDASIQGYQVVFFLSYALVTLFISYFLLPRFLYKKKYLQFFILLALSITFVIVLEEAVLEQIYFPDTRGKKFPGVFYSLLDVLPVITILSGFKFAWDALWKQKEVDQLKEDIKESELQFLKSQINPHFLFNNLNNLYSYAIENSPKTPTIILELSGVLRYMLYECREEFVRLSKEIEQLKNFTQLNELQIEERGTIRFSTSNIQANYQIAPLILIVFIENAFKHSQASLSENISIEIDIQLLDNGQLNFTCINNHQKLANTQDLSHGIGLENVRKRLELLYPNAHYLNIVEEQNRYEVQLSLQLKKAV